MSESPNVNDADRLIYGGLLGLAVAGAFQLIDKSQSETLPVVIAGYAFAGSIPLLAASLVTELVRLQQARPAPVAPWRQAVGMIAALTAVVGLAALFFHMGTIAGSLFIGSVVVAALIVRSL